MQRREQGTYFGLHVVQHVAHTQIFVLSFVMSPWKYMCIYIVLVRIVFCLQRKLWTLKHWMKRPITFKMASSFDQWPFWSFSDGLLTRLCQYVSTCEFVILIQEEIWKTTKAYAQSVYIDRSISSSLTWTSSLARFLLKLTWTKLARKTRKST